MKNKETVIGWVLIIGLMLAFFFYQNKKFAEDQKLKKEQLKTQQAEKAKETAAGKYVSSTDSTAKDLSAPANGTAIIKDSSAASSQLGPFAHAFTGEEKLFTIENDFQKITLTNKGGQIKSVELKKYKTWDKKPLILFTDKTNSLSYQFPIDNNQVIDTKQLYFEALGDGFIVTGDSSKTFAMRVTAGDGKYFEQRFTLKGNSYMLNYDVSFVGLNSVIPANCLYVGVSWDNYLNVLEHNLVNERRYSALYYRDKLGDVSHIGEDKPMDSIRYDTPLEWISYKQQFFNTTLFSKNEFLPGMLKTQFNKE